MFGFYIFLITVGNKNKNIACSYKKENVVYYLTIFFIDHCFFTNIIVKVYAVLKFEVYVLLTIRTQNYYNNKMPIFFVKMFSLNFKL